MRFLQIELRARLAPVFLIFALFAFGALASADIVVLKDGRRIEGKVLKKTAKEVQVKTSFGKLTFQRSEIEEIIVQKTREEEFADKLEVCKTADDFFALGEWCVKNKMKQRAKKMYKRAIDVDSDHEGARTALGYVRYKKEWMTPEERDKRMAQDFEADMRAKGLVSHEGRWVTPEEKANLEKGLVLVNGRWLEEKAAMRAQGLEEFDGRWIPKVEARGRNAAAGAEEAARATFSIVLNEEAMLCGDVAPFLLDDIGAGILKGRAWFNETWNVKPGLRLFGDQLAEFYVFESDRAYMDTVPYLAERSDYVPEGWVAAVQRTHGFVWTDPISISSARRRNRGDVHLTGHCYHHLGHLMLNRLGYSNKLLPPWYDEGVAALVEYHIHEKNAVFCRAAVVETLGSSSDRTREEVSSDIMRDGEWRETMKELIRKGQIEPFDKLARREFSQLELVDIATSMAIVGWIASQGEDALPKFHKALRRGAPPAPIRVIQNGRQRQEYFDAAFRAAVGMGFKQADSAWRKWFLTL